jgi:hypothetical protein
MLVPPDRRTQDRRTDSRLDEPLERVAPRRREERRDAARPFRSLLVQSSVAPLPVPHRASLSLTGARWITVWNPPEDEIVLRLKLPDMPREAVIPARIERRRALENGKVELFAAFTALDLQTELALARYIDARTRLAAALDGREEPGAP